MNHERNILSAAAVIAVTAAVIAGCSAGAVPADGTIDELARYFDTRIPGLMERYDIPGAALAVVSDGSPEWSNAYGFADLASQTPMTVDTVCRTESISKSVTAWGILTLVEAGRIELEAPVERYLGDFELPETAFDEGSVTVAGLLSQTAGMPLGTVGPSVEYRPGEPRPSVREYLSEEARLFRTPGEGFHYSNPGFNILHLVIEEVTGRAFASYMADEVLGPLGMTDSSFAWRDEYAQTMATGYEADGSPVPPYVYPAAASGGLMGSVDDVARFSAAEASGGASVLSAESVRALHTSKIEPSGQYGFVSDGYGFGHFVEELPSGQIAVWHGGQGHGWMTHFHAVPETGDAIVILTNSARSWPFLAAVLGDWARSAGFGTVKFARITVATRVLAVLLGVAVFFVGWEVYRIVSGLRDGSRRVAPFAGRSWGRRVAKAVLAVAGLAALFWNLSLPYSFFPSVFPNLATPAAGTLAAIAVVLLFSAATPAEPE